MAKIYGLPTINIYYYTLLYYKKLNEHKNIRTRYKKNDFCWDWCGTWTLCQLLWSITEFIDDDVISRGLSAYEY